MIAITFDRQKIVECIYNSLDPANPDRVYLLDISESGEVQAWDEHGPYHSDFEDDGEVTVKVLLDEKVLNEAINNLDSYFLSEFVKTFCEEDGSWIDEPTADAIVQTALYGRIVYV